MKTKRKPTLFILWLFAISLVSCSNEEHATNEESLIVARGVPTGRLLQEPADNSLPNIGVPIVFTGKDIAWFDAETREIKFRNSNFSQLYRAYQRIDFEMDDAHLFSATIASDMHSFICRDLVLYYTFDKKGTCRYYLNDAYPDFALNDEQTKENILKRAEGWNIFISQLAKEGRLKAK